MIRIIVDFPTDVPYRMSPPQLLIRRCNQDSCFQAGTARRTGVTPPGYRDCAVYRVQFGFNEPWSSEYYVYDRGELVEWNHWIAQEEL